MLERVFETRPTAGESQGGLNVLTNAHIQYNMYHMHTQTDTNVCVYRNRNFFGNHRKPSVIIESPVSAIRFTHTAVNTFMPRQGFHWPLKMLHYTNVRL